MAKDSIDKGCPMPKPEDLNEAAIEPDDVASLPKAFANPGAKQGFCWQIIEGANI
jgi:hypothetical protein